MATNTQQDLIALSNKFQTPEEHITFPPPGASLYDPRITAVLLGTDEISRLDRVQFITTIYSVRYRISNRKEPLIARIAEAITQINSYMKEHTYTG